MTRRVQAPMTREQAEREVDAWLRALRFPTVGKCVGLTTKRAASEVRRPPSIPTYEWQRLDCEQACAITRGRDPRRFPFIVLLTRAGNREMHCFLEAREAVLWMAELSLLPHVGIGGDDTSDEERDAFRSYWRRCARRRISDSIGFDEVVDKLTDRWQEIGGCRLPAFMRVVLAQENLCELAAALLHGERTLDAVIKELKRSIHPDLIRIDVATWSDLLHADAFEHVRALFAERHDVPSSRGRTFIPAESQDAFIEFLRQSDEWTVDND